MASVAPQTPFDVRRRVSFNDLRQPDQVLGYQAFRVLRFVNDYLRSEGKAPSYTQICDATGIGTKGEVSRIVKSLCRRGLVCVDEQGGRGQVTRIERASNC